MSARLLTRRQVRYLARTPAATAAAVLATALGVASVVAVHLVSERIRDQIDQNSLLAGYTHAVRGGKISGDTYFDLRERWRSGATEPIEAMVPVVEGHATVGGAATRIVGIDLLADTRAGTDARWEGSTERTMPRDGEGTLVELLRGRAAFASTALGLATGDTAQIGTAPPFTEVEIVGTFKARERRLLVDIALAQELLDRPTLTAVWLRAERQTSTLDRWLPGSAAAFGTLAAIRFGDTSQAEALDATEPTRRFAQALTFNLSALGFLALFVAAFLIYQASYANVAHRQRDSERLLAIGVSQATLRRLFVMEGAALGACGGVIGVGAGWALAGMLIDSPLWSNEPVPFSDIAALKGLIGGVGIGALGAFAATAGKRRRWATPIITGLATLLLGIAATANTLAAAFAVILALTGLQIALVTPAVAVLARRRLFDGGKAPKPRSRGALVRRASLRTLALQLDEVSVAVSALTIAIAAAIGVAVMVESFRRDFAALLEQVYWPGVYVEFAAPEQADTPTLAWLEQLPGVAEVRRYGSANALVNGRPVRLTLVPDDAREASRYGHAAPLSDALLLSESGARAYGIEAGDSVMLDGGQDAQAVVVAGLFREYGPAVPGMIAAARHWADALGGVVFSRTVILPDPALQGGDGWRTTLAHTIEQRFPNATVRDDATLKARALEVFDRSHELSSRLTLIALVVAIAGLYTALSAIEARRRGEQRLLYALGTGRRRIARLAVGQCALLGITAAVLATPLGIAIAWALCELVNPRAFGWSITLVLPPAPLPSRCSLASPPRRWPASHRHGARWVRSAHRATMNWRDAACRALVVVATLPLYAAAAPGAGHTDATPTPRGFHLTDALGGAGTNGFHLANTIVPFVFPADHGAHPAFRTEWWYLTAALAAATGEEYGMQFTLFRQGLVPGADAEGWRTTQIYMGHLALTDVAGERHREAERLARGHPRLAGVQATPFALWIDGWRLASTSAAFYPLRLKARDREFGFDLTLANGSAPVPQGDNGLSAKGPNNASHYYSMPRIAIIGGVFQDDRTIPVTGLGWLDREWSSGVLSAEHVGWNWFALQLDDGLDLMAFTLRRRDGTTDPYNQGLLIDANGRRGLRAQDFTLTPLKWWRDADDVRWPVRWKLTFATPLFYQPRAATQSCLGTPVPEPKQMHSLTMEAAINDQVMNTLVRYWEGLVFVRGQDGKDLGRGYMELTGYE